MNKQDTTSEQNISVEELRKMMEERTRLALANEQDKTEQGSATGRIELDHTDIAEAVASIKTALDNFVQVCNEVLPKTNQGVTIEINPFFLDMPPAEAGQVIAESILNELDKR